MKQKLLSCGLFLLGLAGLLALTSWMYFPKDNTRDCGIPYPSADAYALEPAHSLDLLILGDSLPVYGLSPRVIFDTQGIPAYCCATPLQTLAKSLTYLEGFLENQSPRLVLLEAGVLLREMNPLEPVTEALSNRIPVFQYHDNWKRLSPIRLLEVPNWTYRDAERGFYASTLVDPAETADYMVWTGNPEEIPASSRRMLRRLLDLCEENGTRLMLISVPDAAIWNMDRHSAVQALAEELDIPYLDLNLADTGIDWQTDCLDGGDHLNRWGAEKVSVYLADVLADTGLFTDKRGDPAYQAQFSTGEREAAS